MAPAISDGGVFWKPMARKVALLGPLPGLHGATQRNFAATAGRIDADAQAFQRLHIGDAFAGVEEIQGLGDVHVDDLGRSAATAAVNEPPTDSVTSKSPEHRLDCNRTGRIGESGGKALLLIHPLLAGDLHRKRRDGRAGVANRRLPNCSAASALNGKANSAASSNGAVFPK